jgi:hypothetical protein
MSLASSSTVVFAELFKNEFEVFCGLLLLRLAEHQCVPVCVVGMHNID